ncbi:Colicin V production protein [Candidatus Glomeribacter gigasporarum BEG34]|uniref:Colicin V production protein n=1 Tax=Candidatus Glomeribacter gigasporarum BEG34 TaxID=1070319 RepID=G2J7R0_9BURK|nr:CvpA family protein [Candidatus Glomeribacter gigasporarum]CCD28805.1 Colicin V production protein [Candidatus Glomeribacter gigasporarum BEG34]
MTGFDYAVLLIIGLSALRGLWRGLLAELFALIGWIAALIIAGYTADLLAPYLPAHWPGGAFTQFLLAFILIMIAVMLITGVLGTLFERLIGALGMRTLDSSLGLAFGIVRGILLVVAGAALAGLTDLPRQDFWRNALFQPYVAQGVQILKAHFLPAILAPGDQ